MPVASAPPPVHDGPHNPVVSDALARVAAAPKADVPQPEASEPKVEAPERVEAPGQVEAPVRVEAPGQVDAAAPPLPDSVAAIAAAARSAVAATLHEGGGGERPPTSDAATQAAGEAAGEAPGPRRGLARELRWLFAFSVAANLLLLAMPLHMLAVYDRVLASGSGATLFFITALAFGALVLLGVAEIVRLRIAQRMAAGWTARTAEPLFARLVRDDEVRGANGEPVQRASVLRSFYALRSVLGSRAVLAVMDLPFTPVFVLLLFVLHVQIGFLTVGGIALLAALAWGERRMAAGTSDAATRANGEAVTFSQGFVGRAEDIRAMGLFPDVLRHWGTRMGRALVHSDEASRINAAFFGLSRTVRQGLQVLIIAWGAWLVLDGQLSAGVIFAASLISGRALVPVEQVIGAWDRLVQGRRAHEEIEHFLSNAPLPEPAVVPAVTAGDLDVRGLAVEVASGGRTVSILRDVTFALASGECVAVVGASGAGKTTLARCLAGALEPTRGQVRLDDFELSRWPDRRRRESIGYVPQDATLFSGTIADNVSGFAARPDDDAIVAATRAAAVHDAVVRLPEGYGTHVGPGAHELSGGQRSQVALARAFYARPRLLVLDEPNAHLDQPSEDALLRAVARLKSEGVSVVIVSQRRSVLKVADRVLSLEDGRMVSCVENRGQWRARRDDARPAEPKREVGVGRLAAQRAAQSSSGNGGGAA